MDLHTVSLVQKVNARELFCSTKVRHQEVTGCSFGTFGSCDSKKLASRTHCGERGTTESTMTNEEDSDYQYYYSHSMVPGGLGVMS